MKIRKGRIYKYVGRDTHPVYGSLIENGVYKCVVTQEPYYGYPCKVASIAVDEAGQYSYCLWLPTGDSIITKDASDLAPCYVKEMRTFPAVKLNDEGVYDDA